VTPSSISTGYSSYLGYSSFLDFKYMGETNLGVESSFDVTPSYISMGYSSSDLA
jgi:hypothetical protein